jgi:hypothetical protein
MYAWPLWPLASKVRAILCKVITILLIELSSVRWYDGASITSPLPYSLFTQLHFSRKLAGPYCNFCINGVVDHLAQLEPASRPPACLPVQP